MNRRPIPAGAVLRLCVSQAEMDDPVPGSIPKTCGGCDQLVWYDPKASIPGLGSEFVLCVDCFDANFNHAAEMGNVIS